MRLCIAVVFLITAQAFQTGGVPLFVNLPELWRLSISIVLGIWTLAEAVLLTRRLQEGVTEKEALLSQHNQKERQLADSVEETKDAALVEAERNELRTRLATLQINEKEAQELVAALKSKLANLEKERSQGQGSEEQSRNHRAVLAFLSSLQDKGRIVDFLMDDISAYSDAQVGAAARIVHQGCSRVLKQHLSVSPIFKGEEGGQTTLAPGYSPSEWRLVGSVRGQPPFRGNVLHRGWKVDRVELSIPAAGSNQSPVLAPAELELQ